MDWLKPQWKVKLQPFLNCPTAIGCMRLLLNNVCGWCLIGLCVQKSPLYSVSIANFAVFCSHWAPEACLCYWKLVLRSNLRASVSCAVIDHFTMRRYVQSVCFLAGLRLPGLSGKAWLSWNKAAWSAVLWTVHLLALSRSPPHVPANTGRCSQSSTQLHAPPLTQS